ncbi:L-rhamnose mutarotase [Mangrovimonas sp. TPBH4]|uniref:L-rhamnose mutarotase n=1 Tax=Mangrovimonas sp. TPBH4 TaxID=1645914 RepID=UPI0006B5F4DB|nr:L-rhamnose mutarotase [Mangrovimonas sp. TPBH4]
MTYCFTLDLKPDPQLIAQYEDWHNPQNIKPEIVAGLRSIGIEEMQIFRWNTRMCMVVTVPEDFNWEAQMAKLAEMPGQKEWELLMDAYQQRLTDSQDKWLEMTPIFKLTDC